MKDAASCAWVLELAAVVKPVGACTVVVFTFAFCSEGADSFLEQATAAIKKTNSSFDSFIEFNVSSILLFMAEYQKRKSKNK